MRIAALLFVCLHAAEPAPASASTNNSRAVFITFGSARYTAARERLLGEARATGAFASVLGFTPADIASAYAAAHAAILGAERGAGFWLWKPYFVARTFSDLAEGDVLMYADAGCEFVGDPRRYIAIARRHGFLGFRIEAEHTLQRWTKGDVFDRLGLEVGVFGMEAQLVGGIFLIKKDAKGERFVREWLRACEDEQLISDLPSLTPNHESFQGHRHDQAIYSVLVFKLGMQLVLQDQTYPKEKATVISASRRRDS